MKKTACILACVILAGTEALRETAPQRKYSCGVPSSAYCLAPKAQLPAPLPSLTDRKSGVKGTRAVLRGQTEWLSKRLQSLHTELLGEEITIVWDMNLGLRALAGKQTIYLLPPWTAVVRALTRTHPNTFTRSPDRFISILSGLADDTNDLFVYSHQTAADCGIRIFGNEDENTETPLWQVEQWFSPELINVLWNESLGHYQTGSEHGVFMSYTTPAKECLGAFTHIAKTVSSCASVYGIRRIIYDREPSISLFDPNQPSVVFELSEEYAALAWAWMSEKQKMKETMPNMFMVCTKFQFMHELGWGFFVDQERGCLVAAAFSRAPDPLYQLSAFLSAVPLLSDRETNTLLNHKPLHYLVLQADPRIHVPDWAALLEPIAAAPCLFLQKSPAAGQIIVIHDKKPDTLKDAADIVKRRFKGKKIVLKPYNGGGGKGVFIPYRSARTLSVLDLELQKPNKSELVVQERIEPPYLFYDPGTKLYRRWKESDGSRTKIDWNIRSFVTFDERGTPYVVPELVVRAGASGKAVNISRDAQVMSFDELCLSLELNDAEKKQLYSQIKNTSLRAYAAAAKHTGFKTPWIGLDIMVRMHRKGKNGGVNFKIYVIEMNGVTSGAGVDIERHLNKPGIVYLHLVRALSGMIDARSVEELQGSA